MEQRIDDLTNKQTLGTQQSQYAVYLPAISTFYCRGLANSANTRVPAGLEKGIIGLDWLLPQTAYFPYKWSLYSAGHAELDVNKANHGEDMVRYRDHNTSWILGDSGGFQIRKGVWPADWKDPNCPNAMAKRQQVLTWLDTFMDYGMILDIPIRSTENWEASGCKTFADAVKATRINNDYFMRHRSGKCKFLNVLQGETHAQADNWYGQVKDYCDPKKHEQPFNGWAFGGQNMRSPTLALRRIIQLIEDGLLEKGTHDWIHCLGTSRLEWAVFLTDIQNAVRKYHNANLDISFDCASPFLATANGLVYTYNRFEDRGKWTYKMEDTADDKKYHNDKRSFRDAVLQDKIHKLFEDSPISERLTVSDICIYSPTCTNKLGKIGKTSWDSFSYILLMAHNVHRHIEAVQEANRLYISKKSIPAMLVHEQFDQVFISDLVNEIFSTTYTKALKLIKQHDRILSEVIGTGVNVGKKEMNATTNYNVFFS